ncbi:MAG TPA: FAD binding domain-containing protein [Bellilinea sp.]|nr:FAD binding domain-containing protein [Bellilinea sp.]
MKPAPFEYYAPRSEEEALGNLSDLGYSGKVLAGGQSLIPAMNFRMARPAALVDLNKLKSLEYIKPTPEGGLAIGTMTRVRVVEKDETVNRLFPIVRETVKYIAHAQIRARGTFGGAAAHADPAAQIPALSVALNAKFLVKRKGSERWVGNDEFFTGPFMTVIEPEEMLTEVNLPPLAPRTAGSYKQVSRQKGGYAQAAAISVIGLDDANKVKSARVVLFSVGETPILSSYASQVMVGNVATPEMVKDIAAYAAKNECDPGTDLHGTTEYRRQLVQVLVERSINEALARAGK